MLNHVLDLRGRPLNGEGEGERARDGVSESEFECERARERKRARKRERRSSPANGPAAAELLRLWGARTCAGARTCLRGSCTS